MTGWYNSSWRARFLEYRKEGDGWSHPLLLCDKTHRRRTMMSGDDRQNSPSISRQNRPSATVRNGDIIISVAGTLGKLNIITSDLDGVNLTENCDRFTNFRGINPEYLYHVLSSDLIQSQIEASKTKNGQPKLALERIRNFVVPVPHQVRQEHFVEVMDDIDKYIASQQAILDRYCKARVGLLQQLFI